MLPQFLVMGFLHLAVGAGGFGLFRFVEWRLGIDDARDEQAGTIFAVVLLISFGLSTLNLLSSPQRVAGVMRFALGLLVGFLVAAVTVVAVTYMTRLTAPVAMILSLGITLATAIAATRWRVLQVW